MQVTLDDIDEYVRNAPEYKNGIIFVQSGIDEKDTSCWVSWLRTLCKKTEGLSFMFITSNHDSKKPIDKKRIRTGKPGRPKTVVQGTAAEPHCHGLLVNESAKTDIEDVKELLRNYCRKRRKKRPKLKRQKVSDSWNEGLPIVSYMYRQMNETKPYKYGSFNFEYFADIRYCKYHEEHNNYDEILDI
jgi:hypothetical protein